MCRFSLFRPIFRFCIDIKLTVRTTRSRSGRPAPTRRPSGSRVPPGEGGSPCRTVRAKRREPGRGRAVRPRRTEPPFPVEIASRLPVVCPESDDVLSVVGRQSGVPGARHGHTLRSPPRGGPILSHPFAAAPTGSRVTRSQSVPVRPNGYPRCGRDRGGPTRGNRSRPTRPGTGKYPRRN